jgi:cytochrome c556
MFKALVLATAMTVSLALAGSCRQSADRRYGKAGEAPGAGTQPRHAGEDLRQTMHRLGEQMAYSPTGKLPPDPESEKPVDPRVFDEAAEQAAGVAKAAGQIPHAAKSQQLSDADLRAFKAEAETLRAHALSLERAARERKIEQMQRSSDRINATCIACHSRFRDFAGDIEFPRSEGPRGPRAGLELASRTP